MKKTELIAAIAEKTGATKKATEEFLNATSEVILEVIAKEDSVKLGDVCTFSGVTKEAHKARNPLTGETIDVPEKHGYPKCKFSKVAKE